MESVWKAVEYKNTDFCRFLSYQLSNNLFNTVRKEIDADDAKIQTLWNSPVGFPPNEQLYYYY